MIADKREILKDENGYYYIRAVFERDNFTCQICGITKCYIHAHHIRPFKKYPELRTTISNGITLCPACHKAEHKKINKLEARYAI